MRPTASEGALLPRHPLIFNSSVLGSTRNLWNNFSLCVFICWLSLVLLRYNWHMVLSKFKMYNVMIWYMYVFWNAYHQKRLVNTSFTWYSYHFVVAVTARILRKLDHLSSFQVHSAVLLTADTILNITLHPWNSPIFNWIFGIWPPSPHFPQPLSPWQPPFHSVLWVQCF